MQHIIDTVQGVVQGIQYHGKRYGENPTTITPRDITRIECKVLPIAHVREDEVDLGFDIYIYIYTQLFFSQKHLRCLGSRLVASPAGERGKAYVDNVE